MWVPPNKVWPGSPMGGPKLYFGGNNTDTHLKCVGAELGQIFNLQISLVQKTHLY